MPMDIFAPEGALDRTKLDSLAENLTETLLRWTDATEDPFLRSNVAVFVHVMSEPFVFAGGRRAPVVRVDVKMPPIALSSQERRAGFISHATALVRDAATAPLEHVWVFISHATEGGWGIDGRALTSEEMG